MHSGAPAGPRDEVRTFWTGPALSFYEILSLKSLVATGARVLLYSYESDLEVPDGVELLDANEVLSGTVHEFRHANGDKSLALHSDLFRYVVLQRYGGWYADLDIICLKDTLPTDKTYFAFMAKELLNSAILKFPPRSAFMETILDEAWRTLPEAGMATTDAARVSVGPTLFTRMIYEHALDHLVLPKSKAYELGYHETMAFFDPAQCGRVLERLADSDFTHFWNEEWRMIRIPKNFGPPKGSFLDLMFEKFDIAVPERARHPVEAIEAWMREHRLLKDIRVKLGIERISEFTIDELAQSIQMFGWQPRDRLYYHWYYGIEYDKDELPRHPQASKPQTIRTFWQGDTFWPYQLLGLKSFVDRGHRVEVYSYNTQLNAPHWLDLKDATEILAQGQMLHPLPHGGFAINSNLFRYALLDRLGGWWIDPDVVLMKEDLPEGDVFLADSDAFGCVPTAVLKFPAGHPLLREALVQTRALGDEPSDWDRAGGALLTSLAFDHDLAKPKEGRENLGPISWFNVPDLFNPSKTEGLSQKCAASYFLHLQDEVWRRSGVPHWLAPPQGAFLDSLFAQHDISIKFPARMNFAHVNLWMGHMYRIAQTQRGTVV